MLKRSFIAIVMTLFTFYAGLASAEGTGFYLAPKFLMSIQSTGTMSRSGSLWGTDISDYNQFTLGGGLAAGYDFWTQQMIPLRLEVEFALRGNSETNWTPSRWGVDEIKGVWNNSTLFANVFWDFHNDSSFTPYVTGGLGLAFNYTGYDFKLSNGETISTDDRRTNFAWNLGAGVSYSFNEMFAIDASYRFVGLGYNELSKTRDGIKYEVSNTPYNNEFMVGLRFMF